MAAELIDGNLVESKQVSESVERFCQLRDHYKSDIIDSTEKLAEVEAKIAKAKELGFEE